MATIIKSVAFKNFYNYYGGFEHNQYNFTEGINIINADNNMGKSKFYNGFMWLLNDTVYDSDLKSSQDANESLEKMASGKAKKEDKNFEVAVKIVFINDGVEYTIKKSSDFTTVNDVLTHTSAKTTIIKTENNADTPILDKKEQQDIIDNIFMPISLRPYSLLQGESMDRLVDLSSKQALSIMIDTLAGISVLKGTCDIAKKMSKKASDLYQKVDGENSQNNAAKKIDREKLNQCNKKLDELQELLNIAEAEISAAMLKKEELDAYIGNSKKRNAIRAELNKIHDLILRKEEEIRKINSSITQKIFDDENPWLLMELGQEIEVYNKKREKYIGDLAVQNNDGALVIMLPEGSPDISSLKRMLKNEKCEVCGQSALKHSEAWEHINCILNRPKKKNTTKNDFKQFYGDLEKFVSQYSLKIPNIENKIDELEDYLYKLKEELDVLFSDKEECLVKYNNAGGNSDNSEFEDGSLISDYDSAITTINVKGREVETLKNQIDNCLLVREKLETQLKQYKNNPETQKYEDFKNLMKNIEILFHETKDSIFERTIKKLEKEANVKYEQLTDGNQSSGGKLVFKKEHDIVNVSIRDVNNGLITGLGTGFQRMKQLAIVMAVISSKIGNQRKFDYPFISDAPFSEFGENFINNFFNVAPNVFSQSIIMIKELYDPKSQDLLTPFGRKILDKMLSSVIPGTFYVNVIEEKADTTGLVTSHKCYKI